MEKNEDLREELRAAIFTELQKRFVGCRATPEILVNAEYVIKDVVKRFEAQQKLPRLGPDFQWKPLPEFQLQMSSPNELRILAKNDEARFILGEEE